MVGLGTVDGDWIHQSISWRRPPHHTSQLNYTIRYGLSTNMGLSTNISTSNTTVLVIIELPKPTKQTVYNVWVAAVSDVGQGEYRMINITYRGEKITYESQFDNDVCLLHNTSLQSPVLQRTLQSSMKLVTVYQFSGHLHLTQED